MGSFRLTRGGRLFDTSHYCRGSQRNGSNPLDGANFIGFRVARNP